MSVHNDRAFKARHVPLVRIAMARSSAWAPDTRLRAAFCTRRSPQKFG